MSNFLIDEDTGLLAAEFVLGTLDSAERTHAHSLLKVDHGFIAMVRIWERRFGDLHLMVEPVEPDAKILERIKAKLPAPTVAVESGGTGGDAPKTSPAPSAEPPNAPVAAEPTPSAPPPAAVAEVSKPPEAPNPPETSAPPAPAVETTAPPGLPPAASIPLSAETRPSEEKPKNGRGPLPKAGTVPPPPSSLKPPDRAPDRLQDRRVDRRSEVTVDVIRSRRRWRVFGIFMILVVFGLAGLVGAWRFAPERLPPVLQPAAVMTMIGIQPSQAPPPARKEPPPESQFDE